MAAVTRQPFAPLDGARLQSLTSLKNRQNAISPPAAAAGKRKAELLGTDDFENVDPLVFAKRSKGANTGIPSKDVVKNPPALLLTTASTPPPRVRAALDSAVRPASTSRRVLQPKSRVAKLDKAASRSSPVSAPAGRSPTRARRSGLVSSHRRPVSPCGLGSESLSLDAALKGTIPGYGGARPKAAVAESSAATRACACLPDPDAQPSWFFDIHVDSPEQEMTNLLQHSTCVLDISSDEESEQKARRDRAEGRDKENIPPADDVSQMTSARRAARLSAHEMTVDKERVALAEMNTANFYPQGCDASSVVIISADEEDHQLPATAAVRAPAVKRLGTPAPALPALLEHVGAGLDAVESVDLLMSTCDGSSSKAAVLQPIEGTGESFELWESGSAKDESETLAAES